MSVALPDGLLSVLLVHCGRQSVQAFQAESAALLPLALGDGATGAAAANRRAACKRRPRAGSAAQSNVITSYDGIPASALHIKPPHRGLCVSVVCRSNVSLPGV
jgi:hypothetical protein